LPQSFVEIKGERTVSNKKSIEPNARPIRLTAKPKGNVGCQTTESEDTKKKKKKKKKKQKKKKKKWEKGKELHSYKLP